MHSLRTLGITLLSSSLLFSSIGCGSGSGGGAKGPQGHAANDADVAMLPSNSAIVFGADVRKLRASELGGKLWPELVQSVMHETFESDAPCLQQQYDAVTSVTGALARPWIVVVAHGLKRADTMACIHTILQADSTKGSIVENDTVALLEDDADIALTFVNDDTAVIIADDDDKHPTAADVLGLAHGEHGIGGDANFQQAYGQLPGGADAWAVGTNFGQIDDDLDGLHRGLATFKAGSTYDLWVQLEVANASFGGEVMQALVKLNQELSEEHLPPIDFQQNGERITIKGSATAQQVMQTLQH